MWRSLGKGILTVLLVFSATQQLRSEQLPIRIYTTADGLVQNNVIRIVRDSRGFLWFCTQDGLSRYDGHVFKNYDMSHGLPNSTVNHLLEARDGSYWIATNGGGVARLKPPAVVGGEAVESQKTSVAEAPSLFTVYPVGDSPPTNRVNILFQDSAGRIWAGTDGEVFRLEEENGREVFRKVDLGLPRNHRWVVVLAFAEDRAGWLWIGTWEGVFVRMPDGRTTHLGIRPAQTFDYVRALLADKEGRIWIGHMGAGLIELDLSHAHEIIAQLPTNRASVDELRPAIRRWFTEADGLADQTVYSIYQSSEGRIWIGSSTGLSEYDQGRFRAMTKEEGVGVAPLAWLIEDTEGSLWVATGQATAKIARNGLTIFDRREGVGDAGVRTILETASGELYVVANDASIYQFNGQRFTGVRPQALKGVKLEWPQRVLRDQQGDWWVPSFGALYRFAGTASFAQLSAASPKAVYDKRAGLPGENIFHLFEDSHGDIWISISESERNLVRWERATGTFHIYTSAEGLPPFHPASAFAEDQAGALWMGRYDGGVLRYREGRFRLFTTDEGVPAGQVQQLLVDRAGRLWIATNGGVGRVENPTADEPHFTRFSMAEGLASNNVLCLAEDDRGHLYFGTGRGIDRLDPATGRIIHYSTADGLVDNRVEVALRDRRGALWFGAQHSLVRLVPQEPRPGAPPRIFITGLTVAGRPTRLSEVGETEVRGLKLSHTQNQILIEFAGPAFGESLRYQYRLEGGDGDWSEPQSQRSVNFANLAPGSYRFLVRALNSHGVSSREAASVSFYLAPPIWRRWWFSALILAALFAAGYLLYRFRVAQLLAVANMRTHIATDLHDDIGANLTRIAILSEVAKQQLGNGRAEPDGPLSSIARIARESVASMSDIVWAINPQRDNLLDLTRRMRRHAEEVFTLRGIELNFNAAAAEQDLKLGVDVRRDLLLIFKEAMNNAARHSHCSRVDIDFRHRGAWLELLVTDDGKGFDTGREGEGQGLANMGRRAAALKGDLRVVSSKGHGTTVHLTVPVVRSRAVL